MAFLKRIGVYSLAPTQSVCTRGGGVGLSGVGESSMISLSVLQLSKQMIATTLLNIGTEQIIVFTNDPIAFVW